LVESWLFQTRSKIRPPNVISHTLKKGIINIKLRTVLNYGLILILYGITGHIVGGLILNKCDTAFINGNINLTSMIVLIIIPLVFIGRLRRTIRLKFWDKFIIISLTLIFNFLFTMFINLFNLFNRIHSFQEYIDGVKNSSIIAFVMVMPLTLILALFIRNKTVDIQE